MLDQFGFPFRKSKKPFQQTIEYVNKPDRKNPLVEGSPFCQKGISRVNHIK